MTERNYTIKTRKLPNGSLETKYFRHGKPIVQDVDDEFQITLTNFQRSLVRKENLGLVAITIKD